MTTFDAIAVSGVLTGALSLALNYRHRLALARSASTLRTEMAAKHDECLRQVEQVTGRLETSERNAQSSAELLRDGRLSVPVRSRALGMLRSGLAPDTIAAELGLARAEMRLLGKVSALLTPGR